MGRHAKGWTIRLPKGSKTYSARWWSVEEQRQIELSTGETDRKRAEIEAPKIYAKYTNRKLKSRGVKPEPLLDTLDTSVKWIASLEGVLADNTLVTYSGYFESLLAPFFPNLTDVTAPKFKEYIAKRLEEVQAPTIRHERSALNMLLQWAQERGLIEEAPLLPPVPKRALGTPYKHKRRQKPGELVQEEIEAFLEALPIRTKKLGFVRPRFILGYETFLRPSTLDRLKSPNHWVKGSNYLTLTSRSMKGRKEHTLPLSDRAREALETAYQRPGYLFGKHDYRLVVEKAAKVLPEHKRAWFIGAHLRSAGVTHFSDGDAPVTAAQYGAAHSQATTTNRSIKPSQKAFEQALIRQGRKKPKQGG